jgi:hypothetical protein
MGINGNNISSPRGVASPALPPSSSSRAPRRLVLLREGTESAVEQVLAEYSGAEVSGKRLHADLQRLAGAHPGRYIAAEWHGDLGWTRFLWCRK